MDQITVQIREEDVERYIIDVVVSDGDEALTYVVDVTKNDHERLTQGDVSVEDLVRESFLFLLARESKESILRAFDLMVIAQYFPAYEEEMKEKFA